jgi:hypothetical protein
MLILGINQLVYPVVDVSIAFQLVAQPVPVGDAVLEGIGTGEVGLAGIYLPQVFIDTGELGEKRNEMTARAGLQTDLALILYTEEEDDLPERQRIDAFRRQRTPVIAVIAKADTRDREEMSRLKSRIEKTADIPE